MSLNDLTYREILKVIDTLEKRVSETLADNKFLKEENDRLIKAGDEMDAYLKKQDGTTNGMLPCRAAWLLAKDVLS